MDRDGGVPQSPITDRGQQTGSGSMDALSASGDGLWEPAKREYRGRGGPPGTSVEIIVTPDTSKINNSLLKC